MHRMEYPRMNIEPLTDTGNAPLELLYTADPSVGAVADYLRRGDCFVGMIGDEVAGVYVLLPTRPFTVELVNVAVGEKFQGKGYGKQLVNHAVGQARSRGYKTIEVGTGNCGMMQLALYQKCGFSMTHIDVDFFRRHYPEPIFENGMECRHMVRLSQDL